MTGSETPAWMGKSRAARTHINLGIGGAGAVPPSATAAINPPPDPLPKALPLSPSRPKRPPLSSQVPALADPQATENTAQIISANVAGNYAALAHNHSMIDAQTTIAPPPFPCSLVPSVRTPAFYPPPPLYPTGVSKRPSSQPTSFRINRGIPRKARNRVNFRRQTSPRVQNIGPFSGVSSPNCQLAVLLTRRVLRIRHVASSAATPPATPPSG